MNKKTFLIKTSIFLFFFSTLTLFSQIDVSIENGEYLSNSISNCGTVKLNLLSSGHSISFNANVEVSSYEEGPVYTYGNLKIIYWTGSGEIIYDTKPVNSSHWTYNESASKAYLDIPVIMILDSSDFDESTGGQVYIRYEESINNFIRESCKYNIVKPEFSISPDDVAVFCSSTAKSFTVSNVNNTPGTLEYQWQVGSGWLYNGNAISNFTTTTNSISLTPYSYPPSNVKVRPILGGNSYSQLISNVSLADYNPINQISGSNQLCANATYSVSNLPAGTTLSSWTSSNSSIATMVTNSNNQGVLTAVGNGAITVSATLTNSCGQTAIITKENIEVGAPTVINYGINGGSTNVFTNSVSYFSISPVVGSVSYYWWITPASGCSAGFGPTINNVNPYTSSSSSAMVRWGACPGRYSVVCWSINDCGTTSIGQKFVTVNDPSTNPCNNNFTLQVSPNPNKGKKIDVTINLLPNPDPCPTLALAKTVDENYNVEVYDFYGEQRFSGNFKSEKFTLGKLRLKKGTYFVKVTSSSGINESKTLIID